MLPALGFAFSLLLILPRLVAAVLCTKGLVTAGGYKYLAALGANLLFYKLTAVCCKPFSLAFCPIGFLPCALLLQPFRRCLCFLCLYLGNFLRRVVDIDLPNIVKVNINLWLCAARRRSSAHSAGPAGG